MFIEDFSSSCYVVLVILLAEVVLSVPQGYNYYANQQRNYYAQRAAQVQRIEAQRIAARNRYNQHAFKTTTTRKPYKINKADTENAKFLGLQNQEPDESGKTFQKKARKLFGAGYGGGYGPGYGAGFGNGCGFRKTDQKEGEGRVFWDLNVYNVYGDGGCGYGGAGGGGLSDPYPGAYPGAYGGGWADPYYGGRPVRGFFQNWLGLFLPGGALSGVNRPSPQSDPQSDSTNSGASNAGNVVPPAPNFQFLSDEEAMPTLTPNQLVSGVASTINNVFQQLSYPFNG